MDEHNKMDDLQKDIVEIKVHLAHIDEKLESIKDTRRSDVDRTRWWVYFLLIFFANLGSIILAIFHF